MKITISLLILFLLLALSSCSTLSGPSTDDDEALRKLINDANDAFLVSADTPYVFNKEALIDFTHDFVIRHCKGEEKKDVALLSNQCSEKITQSGVEKLQERYFDADVGQLQQVCALVPLPCLELPTLEYLFRTSHNEGIEKSRHEKLALLKLWKNGQISKTALLEKLHLTGTTGATMLAGQK